jgi:hypothetical protein
MNQPGRFATFCHKPSRHKSPEQRIGSLTAQLRTAERDSYRRGVEDAIAVVRDRGQRCNGMIDPDETAREIMARLLTDEGRAIWQR